MLRPTRRALWIGALGAPLAAAPALLGEGLWPLWVGYVAAFGLALGLDALLVPRRARLRVAIEAPAAMQVGVPAAARVEVTAPPTLRSAAAVAAGAGPLDPCAPQTVAFAAGVAQFHVPLRASRRGRAHLASLWLRWTGPLGLLWNEHVFSAQASIDVLPDTRAVRSRALLWRSNPEHRAGLKVEHYLGDGSEFDSLREYVVGFDRRSVDWKASARHRELLCRQYRAERNHQVVLAIDTGHRMGESIDGVPRVDHAIRLALELAFTCLTTGDLVGTFAFADRPLLLQQPHGGLPTLARLQHALAGLDYSTSETNFTVALTHLVAEVRRRSLVVLFTDFVDSTMAELMVPNVLRLARRHLVLFVALRDPALGAALEKEPERLSDVHRAVVAGDLERDRERVLERIRRAGVHVVDATPREVGAQVVQRYLELKRREAV